MDKPRDFLTWCRTFAPVLIAGVLVTVNAGCGSTSGGGSGLNYPDVTGNWQFALQVTLPTPPALPANPVILLSGSLTSSGGSVTGILRAQGLGFPPCNSPTTDLAATGKIDTSGNVTVTAPLAGGVATIAFNSQTPLIAVAIGTYQVVGGPCAQPSIALSALKVPNVTGTYQGTMTQFVPLPSGTAPTASVTAVLVQSSTPNIDGQFPLTGTITATGACVTTLTITQGVVSGIQIQSYPSTSLPSPLGAIFSGVVTPSIQLQAIAGNLFQPTGCPGFAYSGQLNLQ